MGYHTDSIKHELKIIDFLLGNGKISSEEASYLRGYLQTLV